MKVETVEQRICLYEINRGLKAASRPIALPFMRPLLAQHARASDGIVFLTADSNEKATQCLNDLLKVLVSDSREKIAVGFDIPSSVMALLVPAVQQARQEIRKTFSQIADYKIAALERCIPGGVPVFGFGEEQMQGKKLRNPWKLSNATSREMWQKEGKKLRQEREKICAPDKKAIIAITEPWSASDIGIPYEFNKEQEGQASLFDHCPHVPWINIKIGESPLPGHETWREACFDWIIKTE